MEFEKYTDPLDTASRNERIATEDSIREARLLSRPHQLPKVRVINGVEQTYYEITDCIECGEEIGEERIKVAIKNTICIDCAKAQERIKR